MPVRDRCIVFDLDGTLADTALDLVPALNRTIATAGLRPVPPGAVRAVVGHGSRVMIGRAFELAGEKLTDHLHDVLHRRFLADYEDNIATNTVLYEEAEETLAGLAKEGFPLAVCTNKPAAMARLLLDRLGIVRRFAAITGGDSFAFKKPDPRHLIETVRLAGAAPARAVMVGDSLSDIRAARQAGMPVIAVDFGYSAEPVATLAPDAVISRFGQLPKTIASL
jgi:phosphoglycolate phosphatase